MVNKETILDLFYSRILECYSRILECYSRILECYCRILEDKSKKKGGGRRAWSHD